jgi:hypothetical protein
MPVDPFHLDPHRQQPAPPKPGSGFHPLYLIGGVIVIIAGLAAAWVWGDKAPTILYLKSIAAILALIFLWRLKVGWDDDGIAGLWYFWHQPWGSSLLGDDAGPSNQDPLTSTTWWVGLALSALGIAVAARLFL